MDIELMGKTKEQMKAKVCELIDGEGGTEIINVMQKSYEGHSDSGTGARPTKFKHKAGVTFVLGVANERILVKAEATVSDAPRAFESSEGIVDMEPGLFDGKEEE